MQTAIHIAEITKRYRGSIIEKEMNFFATTITANELIDTNRCAIGKPVGPYLVIRNGVNIHVITVIAIIYVNVYRTLPKELNMLIIGEESDTKKEENMNVYKNGNATANLPYLGTTATISGIIIKVPASAGAIIAV